MRLILVRHGQTENNRRHLVQGQSDSELNELGRAQAGAVAGALKEERVDAIYTSPLKRAWDTAHAINGFHGVDMVTLDGLKELDVGEYDGLPLEEMIVKYQALLAGSAHESTTVRFPGGESIADLRERIWTAFQFIISKRYDSVVVVGHNLSLTGIISQALGTQRSNAVRLSLESTAVNVIETDGALFRLALFNDTCHLGKALR
ncbi:histidine phosphatase family protein [Chloroflexota bacterium]